MNYESFLYGLLFLLGAVIYFIFNRWSLKNRDGNENPDLYSKSQTELQNFNSWVIILGFVIAAIVCFFKSII